MYTSITLLTALAGLVHAWMPADHGLIKARGGKGSNKIRGVNIGSHFVVEPWMIPDEWEAMGCSAYKSEFDCVAGLGQQAANAAFQKHWANFTTEAELDTMKSWGLNTIRIPVGFWMYEKLVGRNETYPQGGEKYFERVCEWAAERDMYVIVDLHGAPGAQTPWQAFTGKFVEEVQFYNAANYARAYQFLEWMTNLIHTKKAYRTVGMLEVINEPNWDEPTIISEYYPTAYAKIRAVEQSLDVEEDDALHIQFMDSKWQAGNPNQNLNGTFSTAYDNHRYLKSDLTVPPTQLNYLYTSCNDNLVQPGETPLIVGETSIGPRTAYENLPVFTVKDGANKEFYKKWWAAQQMAFERADGWTYWNWKTQLSGGDYRWSYQESVMAGVISKDPNDAYKIGACDDVWK